MSEVVVTGSFTVSWDLDELREQWGEPDATDEQLLQEFIDSVEEDWDFYVVAPDLINVDGAIV